MGRGKQEIAAGCISTGAEADIPCMGKEIPSATRVTGGSGD